MRSRSVALTLFAAVSIILAACSSAATTAPTAAPTAAPTEAMTAAPTAAPTEAPTMAPTEAPTMAPTEAPTQAATKWVVGVVTDVGTLDDKNFNQFSYEGAKLGAADIGAAVPKAIVPAGSSEYKADIQTQIDQGANIIVTVGYAIGNDTIAAAKANPSIWFIGVDQGVCLDEQGKVDSTFACKGDATKLLPNMQGLVFTEQEPGYLAGILAACITKTGVIGAIGGTTTIPPVVRYINGYINGAHQFAKDNSKTVKVKTAYISDDLGKAFNDPAGGKSFAQQFIKQNKPDLLFQVAGKTGNGILAAACDAKIYGIGVDVDQYISTPEADACILTSAEKKLQNAVQAAINKVAAGQAVGGTQMQTSKNGGIGLAPINPAFTSVVTPECQSAVQQAIWALQAGTIQACDPKTCNTPIKGD
jgi:basic membrane protein A